MAWTGGRKGVIRFAYRKARVVVSACCCCYAACWLLLCDDKVLTKRVGVLVDAAHHHEPNVSDGRAICNFETNDSIKI